MKGLSAKTPGIMALVAGGLIAGLGHSAENGNHADRKKTGTIPIYSVNQGGSVMVEKVAKTEKEWKSMLSDQQYSVTRKKGTERAFSGEYWDLHEKGIYKCIGCGTDLFDSDTKFESGTGWPSFYKPLAPQNVEVSKDNTLGMVRNEVLCARCDAHLGHVFDDGTKPTGQRFCINSASLKFEKKP